MSQKTGDKFVGLMLSCIKYIAYNSIEAAWLK